MKLKDKYGNWALVTGASSGIGEAFAYRLAKEGINLMLAARRKERLENLKTILENEFGIEVVAAPIDLTKDNFIDELIEFIGEKEVGILINNAGFGFNGEFKNGEINNDVRMVKLNCVAPIILTHYFTQHMIKRNKGAVIFLGSILAFIPTPMASTYSATKAFNSFLGDSLWYELKKYNIDVLSLNPGGTETEFARISSSSSGPRPRKASDVVDTALKSLGKKPGVVDGLLNKTVVIFTKLLSRKTVVTFAGKIASSLHRKA